MKVLVGFPLSSDGPLGRAAAAAARHPTYRVEGTNGAARVRVELDLPGDWRILDDFSGFLRGEGRVEYAADGAPLQGEELFDGLRCFLRKQRSGASARDWCTPGKLADFVILDRDIMTCPVNDIKYIKVEETYLGGGRVYPLNR